MREFSFACGCRTIPSAHNDTRLSIVGWGYFQNSRYCARGQECPAVMITGIANGIRFLIDRQLSWHLLVTLLRPRFAVAQECYMAAPMVMDAGEGTRTPPTRPMAHLTSSLRSSLRRKKRTVDMVKHADIEVCTGAFCTRFSSG